MAQPPVNTQDADVCTTILRLKLEAMTTRDHFIGWAEVGSNYYHHGTNDVGDDGSILTDSIIIQDIQNNVVTSTNLETQEAPKPKLTVVDPGSPPLFFWALDPQIAVQLGIPPAEVGPSLDPTTQMPVPPAGLSPQSLAIVQQAIAAQLLPPTAISEVSPTEARNMWQRIFDVVWARSEPDEWFENNCLAKNVYGWQPATFEFDDREKKGIFKNIPLRQVFIDPTVERIEDAAYVIIDKVIDTQIAKKLYPQFADQIEEFSQESGSIMRPPNTLQMGEQYETTHYQRPVVTLTVAFFRDQETYMDADDAVAAGQVNKTQVGTDHWTQTGDPENPLQQQMRDAYTHPDTGEELTHPDDPNFTARESQWPTMPCTRQVTTIATHNIVLDDTESNFWDIPLAINRCIRILGRPFGIGDPFRLFRMQDGRSTLMQKMVDHAEYLGSPATELPASARELLPEEHKDGHLHPRMTVWVPDELMAKHPNGVSRFINPPPLPPVLMDIDQRLKSEINDSSGNMDSLQGDDKQTLSGVAIDKRAGLASNAVGFKSKMNEKVLRRMAHLLFYAIRTRMTVKDIARIEKRYPPFVLQQLVDMGNVDDGMEWDFMVSVPTGSGQKDAQDQAEVKDELKLGLVSKQTAREVLNRDNSQEEQRIDKEFREQAALQMALAPPPAVGGGGDGPNASDKGPPPAH